MSSKSQVADSVRTIPVKRNKNYYLFFQACPSDEVEIVSAKDENSEQLRRVFIIRHGERVDFTFGPWIPYCFDDDGNYLRKDLNMPVMVPKRQQGPAGFAKDCPLTNIGILQARLVGESLQEAKISIDNVYCSPSLRCVQTCDALLRGLGRQKETPINIEPGLFEWLVWYPEALPDWLTNEEFIAAGYNVQKDYIPLVGIPQLKEPPRETCEQFYLRSSFVVKSALASTTGNILLVGHAASLEVCSRELLGEKPRPPHELTKLIQKVPYCSLVMIGETDGDSESSKWELLEPPCPPITHSQNQRFDWKVLLS